MKSSKSFDNLNSSCSPAFIIDTRILRRNAERIFNYLGSHTKLLYSVKSLLTESVIQTTSPFVEGYSVSSLNEALFCRDFMPSGRSLHFISPYISDSDLAQLKTICNTITLNSVTQLQRFSAVAGGADLGLRINPGISFLKDRRYDPCRSDSKLGVQLSDLCNIAPHNYLSKIKGLHFHSNCDSDSIQQLIQTLDKVESCLGNTLATLEWMNCGGGYTFTNSDNVHDLVSRLDRLQSKYDLRIHIEPGAAFVRNAGQLIASVVDLVQNGTSIIAILDTSVNHWPEVFEYQFEPDVKDHVEDGRFAYQLAGCSCLAGDVFGTYSFSEPLKIGSRVVFENAGAYSIVKANMFNGINLPTIYTLAESGELLLTKQFTYEDFASRCGVDTRATV